MLTQGWNWIRNNVQGLIVGLLLVTCAWGFYQYVYIEYINHRNMLRWAVQLDRCFQQDKAAVMKGSDSLCKQLHRLQGEIDTLRKNQPVGGIP